VTDDVRRRIGDAIRTLAKERGLSLLQLSRRAKVGKASVYRVVAGKAAAGTGWLAKVAGALNVDVSALLSGLDASPDRAKIRVMQTVQPIEKSPIFKVQFSSADRARVEALAKVFEVPAGAVVRRILKEEADRRGIVVATSPAPKKKTTRAKK